LHASFIAEYLGGLLKVPTTCPAFCPDAFFAKSRNPLNVEAPSGELIVTAKYQSTVNTATDL